MATVELTSDNFEQVVDGHDVVFIDFWAGWCGPCRMFEPIYEEAAQANPDIVFGKVDTEAEPALAQQFGVMSIPTLVIIRDGILLFSQAGVLPAQALEELADKVRGLDMDSVREAVASREASA